jgi:hypothetical protein
VSAFLPRSGVHTHPPGSIGRVSSLPFWSSCVLYLLIVHLDIESQYKIVNDFSVSFDDRLPTPDLSMSSAQTNGQKKWFLQ